MSVLLDCRPRPADARARRRPAAPRRGRGHGGPAGPGRPDPVRRPRLRGQRPGAGRRRRAGDGGAAALRQRAPGRRVPVPGVHRPVRVGAGDRRALRRRARRRRLRAHPPHDRRAEPARGLRARGRGGAGAGLRAPRRPAALAAAAEPVTVLPDRAHRGRHPARAGRRAGPGALRAASPSPGRRTSPGSRCRWPTSSRSPGPPVPACSSTARSSCRTGRSRSPTSGADYVAFSGHKTYAPFGAGALVGRRDWLDAGARVPGRRRRGARGHGGRDDVGAGAAPARGRIAQRPRRGGPRRGLRRAGRAARRCARGARAGAAGPAEPAAWPTCRACGCCGSGPTRRSRPASSGFTVEGADPGLVAAYLSAEHGIGVRDGRFCAHPLLARLGVPEGALRASVGVGSTLADVDRLTGALAEFLARGPRNRYELVAGRWQPVGDPRPLAGLGGADPAVVARGAGCGPANR